MANSVGVNVVATEVPPASTVLYNTANCFMVGRADWGAFNTPTAVTSLAQWASLFGTPTGTGNPNNSRTTTCATMFDAVNTFFQEGPSNPTPILYFSRVSHGSPVAASLVLSNTVPSTALTITAQYAGTGGNGIYIQIVNTGGTSYTISIQDASGNLLVPISGSLTTGAQGVAYCASTGLVTAVAGSGIPVTSAAAPLTGGTDNYGSIALSDYTTALTAFTSTLGPGQVCAPSITNTTLSGIWAALGAHASANNRVAVCDMDDNVSAATLVSDLGSIGTSANASYIGLWGGNRNIPGVTPSTTRSVAPSSIIAALCARVDADGNPNQAAAGVNYPLIYATTPTSQVSGAPYDTYSPADLNTLNASGINTFHTAFGIPENYGFVSCELSTTDQVYWQFNHARMRMAIIAQAQIIGQPFVFSQIDGQQNDQGAFGTALDAMMASWPQGALWLASGATAAYLIDVGTDINTVTTIAAGQLNANIITSFSYFAQGVNIAINVVPITQAV